MAVSIIREIEQLVRLMPSHGWVSDEQTRPLGNEQLALLTELNASPAGPWSPLLTRWSETLSRINGRVQKVVFIRAYMSARNRFNDYVQRQCAGMTWTTYCTFVTDRGLQMLIGFIIRDTNDIIKSIRRRKCVDPVLIDYLANFNDVYMYQFNAMRALDDARDKQLATEASRAAIDPSDEREKMRDSGLEELRMEMTTNITTQCSDRLSSRRVIGDFLQLPSESFVHSTRIIHRLTEVFDALEDMPLYQFTFYGTVERQRTLVDEHARIHCMLGDFATYYRDDTYETRKRITDFCKDATNAFILSKSNESAVVNDDFAIDFRVWSRDKDAARVALKALEQPTFHLNVVPDHDIVRPADNKDISIELVLGSLANSDFSRQFVAQLTRVPVVKVSRKYTYQARGESNTVAGVLDAFADLYCVYLQTMALSSNASTMVTMYTRLGTDEQNRDMKPVPRDVTRILMPGSLYVTHAVLYEIELENDGVRHHARRITVYNSHYTTFLFLLRTYILHLFDWLAARSVVVNRELVEIVVSRKTVDQGDTPDCMLYALVTARLRFGEYNLTGLLNSHAVNYAFGMLRQTLVFIHHLRALQVPDEAVVHAIVDAVKLPAVFPPLGQFGSSTRIPLMPIVQLSGAAPPDDRSVRWSWYTQCPLDADLINDLPIIWRWLDRNECVLIVPVKYSYMTHHNDVLVVRDVIFDVDSGMFMRNEQFAVANELRTHLTRIRPRLVFFLADPEREFLPVLSAIDGEPESATIDAMRETYNMFKHITTFHTRTLSDVAVVPIT